MFAAPKSWDWNFSSADRLSRDANEGCGHVMPETEVESTSGVVSSWELTYEQWSRPLPIPSMYGIFTYIWIGWCLWL